MAKIFLYPNPDKKVVSPNPYISNFTKALLKKHKVVNAGAPNRGVIGFFLFFFSTDLFILNWPETLPEKKFGNFQKMLFKMFLKIKNLFGKKVLWVLHNKGSHHKEDNSVTKEMFDILMLNSDFIITHSNTGKDFVASIYPSFLKKVHVIPHPFTNKLGDDVSGTKVYDFLIWGSIYKYKGIDLFLKYLNNSETLKNSKVLIIGRCGDQEYKKEILSILPKNAEYKDQLLSLEEISSYAGQSRFTLFTYKSKTVISSGSLIDSIRMGAIVLGPDHGAFKDLSGFAFMHTYKDFNEIPQLIADFDPSNSQIELDRKYIMEENTWEQFVKKIENISGI